MLLQPTGLDAQVRASINEARSEICIRFNIFCGDPAEGHFFSLLARYKEEKAAGKYDLDTQVKIEALIKEIKSSFNLIWSAPGMLVSSVKKLEAIFALPTEATQIGDPEEIENQLDQLLASYADEIQPALKSALLPSPSTFGNYLPRRALYLYGIPGAGKTYFINQAAKIAGYDLCVISFTGRPEDHYGELLGRTEWGAGKVEVFMGQLAACYTQVHRDPLDPDLIEKKNTRRKLLFFDDIDRVINEDGTGGIRQFLLKFLTSDLPYIELASLDRVKIDTTETLIALAGNQMITDPTGAFDSRMIVMEFSGYAKEKIIEIANYLFDRGVAARNLEKTPELLRDFAVITDYYNSLSHERMGARELQDMISEVIRVELLRKQGYKNVKANTRFYLEQDKKMKQRRLDEKPKTDAPVT